MSEIGTAPPGRERGTLASVLLAALSILGGIGVAALGVLAAPVAIAALVALVVLRLQRFAVPPPAFPRPRASFAWLGDFGRFVAAFVAWSAPQVPFVAPFLVFVAVTWPLPRESASLAFQEQASQILPVLLIGYVIEVGAIRWRARAVNWILSLMTVAILLAGEVYALVDTATGEPDHADIIAGALAAGVAAILIAAIQGSLERSRAGERPSDR